MENSQMESRGDWVEPTTNLHNSQTESVHTRLRIIPLLSYHKTLNNKKNTIFNQMQTHETENKKYVGHKHLKHLLSKLIFINNPKHQNDKNSK